MNDVHGSGRPIQVPQVPRTPRTSALTCADGCGTWRFGSTAGLPQEVPQSTHPSTASTAIYRKYRNPIMSISPGQSVVCGTCGTCGTSLPVQQEKAS